MSSKLKLKIILQVGIKFLLQIRNPKFKLGNLAKII